MNVESNNEVLKAVKKGNVLKLTMNRVKQRNALNSALKKALIDALNNASSDPEIKAVILTAAGEKAFSAGQDLKEGLSMPIEEIESEIYELYRTLYYFPKPLIAAVNGAAAGGGFALCLLSDFRVADKSCTFSMPEINVALPCVNGSTFLMRLLGEARTMDFVLRGRLLTATEAYDWGILTEIVEEGDLIEKAWRLADQLVEKSSMAYSINKLWIRGLDEFDWEKTKKYFKRSIKELTDSGELYKYMAKFGAKPKD